jgi:hypothetical protein
MVAPTSPPQPPLLLAAPWSCPWRKLVLDDNLTEEVRGGGAT